MAAKEKGVPIEGQRFDFSYFQRLMAVSKVVYEEDMVIFYHGKSLSFQIR